MPEQHVKQFHIVCFQVYLYLSFSVACQVNKATTNVSFLKPRNQQTRKIPPNRVWLSGKGLGEDDKEDKRYKEVKHGHAGVCAVCCIFYSLCM